MKANELVPIFRQIMTAFPIFSYHKRILLISPLGRLLRGVHFDPSAFSKDFFEVTVFRMPLCVPTEYLTLTFGERVYLPNQVWSMQIPDLAARLSERIGECAMPFLNAAPNLEAFPATIGPDYGNPHGPKAAAYALARVGETRKAVALIEDYLPKLRPWPPWQVQIGEDSRALRHLLLYEPDLAAAKLEAWENETIRNLRLERFR